MNEIAVGDEVIFYDDPWSGPRFRVLEVQGDMIRTECLCDCGFRVHRARGHVAGWAFANWYRKYSATEPDVAPAEAFPPLRVVEESREDEEGTEGELMAGVVMSSDLFEEIEDLNEAV